MADSHAEVRRDAEQMTVSEAVAELQRLEGQQATIEHALGEPTRRGEALRVVLAELEQAERNLNGYSEMLDKAEARLAKVPALVLDEWQEHEGMVTVYDAEGHYLGCMGVDSWRILLAEGDTA